MADQLDVLIVAVLHPPHAARLADLFGPEFVCDFEAIRDAIAERRIFSVFHREALQTVDVIVRQDQEYEIEKFERRRRVEVDGPPMWMISPEDLVLSKLWAKDSRSELQLRDVRSIIALQPGLDWPYVDRWAIRLTVARLLAEFRE